MYTHVDSDDDRSLSPMSNTKMKHFDNYICVTRVMKEYYDEEKAKMYCTPRRTDYSEDDDDVIHDNYVCLYDSEYSDDNDSQPEDDNESVDSDSDECEYDPFHVDPMYRQVAIKFAYS